MKPTLSSCYNGALSVVRSGFAISCVKYVWFGLPALIAFACAHGIDMEGGVFADGGGPSNPIGVGGSGPQSGATSGTAGGTDTGSSSTGSATGATGGGSATSGTGSAGAGGSGTTSGAGGTLGSGGSGSSAGAGGSAGRGGGGAGGGSGSGGSAAGRGGSSGAGGTAGSGGRGGSGGSSGASGSSGAGGSSGRGGSGGAVGGPPCSAAYSNSNCFGYIAGQQVSRNGHNYTCAVGECRNCAATPSCEPGASGCPWGNVWTDDGVCQ
jgi:hypothetical protein